MLTIAHPYTSKWAISDTRTAPPEVVCTELPTLNIKDLEDMAINKAVHISSTLESAAEVLGMTLRTLHRRKGDMIMRNVWKGK